MTRAVCRSVAATVWLAGCAVGPAPRIDDPTPVPAATGRALPPAPARGFLDSLRLARSAESAAPSAAPLRLDPTDDLAWLDLLHDPTLVALVTAAVAGNRDLHVALASVREYRALLGASRGALLPRVDANAGVARNRIAFGSQPIEYDAIRVTADLVWELDFWGGLRRRVQAADADLDAREADQRAVVLSLVADVVTGYLELRELDEQLLVAERTLASRETTLRLARQRFDQGVIAELDVRQFEAEMAGPAARVAEFTRLRGETESRLNLLLGQRPGPIARGRTLLEAVRTIVVPDSIPGDVLTRRPDVLRARLDAEAARARIGAATAARFPRFVISGQYGTQSPDTQGLFDSNGEIYTIQGGVSLPLFAGGQLRAQQEAARARADQAVAHYEQSLLVAFREATDALNGARLIRDQLAAQETQVGALRRALALAEQRYGAGISSYLEVLDVQRALFNAELALTQVQRQYLATSVQLYKALGGGWPIDR